MFKGPQRSAIQDEGARFEHVLQDKIRIDQITEEQEKDFIDSRSISLRLRNEL